MHQLHIQSMLFYWSPRGVFLYVRRRLATVAATGERKISPMLRVRPLLITRRAHMHGYLFIGTRVHYKLVPCICMCAVMPSSQSARIDDYGNGANHRARILIA